MDFMKEYNKQWDDDIEPYIPRSKKSTPAQLHNAKQIRVEKVTRDYIKDQEPHGRIEYERSLRQPGKATTASKNT